MANLSAVGSLLERPSSRACEAFMSPLGSSDPGIEMTSAKIAFSHSDKELQWSGLMGMRVLQIDPIQKELAESSPY